MKGLKRKKEGMAEMMMRVADGIPSQNWIQTSVGLVNTRNPGKMGEAALKLAKLRTSGEGK